jgi:hypothetical protein
MKSCALFQLRRPLFIAIGERRRCRGSGCGTLLSSAASTSANFLVVFDRNMFDLQDAPGDGGRSADSTIQSAGHIRRQYPNAALRPGRAVLALWNFRPAGSCSYPLAGGAESRRYSVLGILFCKF